MKTKLVNENFKTNWVENLLLSRGVQGGDLKKFYDPTWENISSPDLLDNVEAAAQEIIKAVKEHKHIGLIVDCDVDGITSGTVIYSYLHELDPDVNITYFFHSGKQHGLEDCWENFIEAGADIVIEPDSGINDKQYHDLLGEKGIRTMVLDHHEYEGHGYSDYAIYVDNQTSPQYPNKSLAGCGVTWQTCREMDKLLGLSYADKYIDLVALGCASDVMSPLTLENRAVFDIGFDNVQYPTFKAFCDKQSYSMGGVVDYTTVAFYVAPLINACMRTGEADEKLLMYKMFLHPDMRLQIYDDRWSEVVDTVEKDVLTYPEEERPTISDVRVIQWKGGEHYYAKIGKLDVLDEFGNQKWSSEEEALDAAEWFIEDNRKHCPVERIDNHHLCIHKSTQPGCHRREHAIFNPVFNIPLRAVLNLTLRHNGERLKSLLFCHSFYQGFLLLAWVKNIIKQISFALWFIFILYKFYIILFFK
jgi:hypothetical protein